MNRTLVAKELLAIAKELVAMEFPTQDAYDKYMKDHPDADKSLHTIKETKKEPAKKEEGPKNKPDERKIGDLGPFAGDHVIMQLGKDLQNMGVGHGSPTMDEEILYTFKSKDGTAHSWNVNTDGNNVVIYQDKLNKKGKRKIDRLKIEDNMTVSEISRKVADFLEKRAREKGAKEARDLMARPKKEECPECGKEYNTSEMVLDKKRRTLNCPDCGATIIEHYLGE